MKVKLENLELKTLDKRGLRTLLDWAKKEGWNPGDNDFDVFWKTDPQGYYGFYFNKELIAAGAIISYNKEYGFMGLFIVDSNYRAQGIGRKLWYLRRDLLISRLNQGATIGMDGVVAMQPFYEKGGFKIAFTDERYEYTGRKESVNNAISVSNAKDIEDMVAYDIACFGYQRKQFLENWLVIPDSTSFKFSEKKQIKGYAVIRKVHSGYKIGPLFADNEHIAEELFKACLNSAEGKSVYLDIPVINTAAVELAKKYKGTYVFQCARMYYGDPPPMAIHKVFGITTIELG